MRSSVDTRHRVRSRFTTALYANAILIGGLLTGCSRHENAPAPTSVTQPGTFRATPEQYAGLTIAPAIGSGQEEGARASGVIAVDGDRSTQVFPPYSGLVTRVLAEAGQRVEAGQPLLLVRASEYVDARNALLAAAAQRDTATSALRVATTNAARAQEIFRTAGGALRDAQAAQNDLAAARAAVRTAEAALGAARDKLAVLGKNPTEISQLESANGLQGTNPETRLLSPIDGIVSTRAVGIGQYIHAGDSNPAFVITDPSSVWLIAQLAESDAARVRVGDRVSVTTPAYPGRTFRARVDNVGAALDPVSHRLPVRATIRNADGVLKPQMFANFTIEPSSPSNPRIDGGVSVPASAVIHEGDGARVWVAEPGRVLRAREVSVGDSSNGMVRVLRGLNPGERVVTAGALFVNEAGLPG